MTRAGDPQPSPRVQEIFPGGIIPYVATMNIQSGCSCPLSSRYAVNIFVKRLSDSGESERLALCHHIALRRTVYGQLGSAAFSQFGHVFRPVFIS